MDVAHTEQRLIVMEYLYGRLGNQEPRIMALGALRAVLYDYHRGVDFAAHGGLAQTFDHMHVVHRGNVSRFNDVALKRSEALDFRVYSKALNPGPGPDDFRLARLVDPGNV